MELKKKRQTKTEYWTTEQKQIAIQIESTEAGTQAKENNNLIFSASIKVEIENDWRAIWKGKIDRIMSLSAESFEVYTEDERQKPRMKLFCAKDWTK